MRLFVITGAIFSLFPVICAIKWDAFATQTSYFWSRNTSSISADMGSFSMENTTCEPAYVNMVVRHGARNPVASAITKMKALHAKLVSHKPPNMFPFLDQWTSRYDLATEGQLVPIGANEEEFIGNRIGDSLRALFNPSRHVDVQFVTSDSKRTIDSARSFHRGLAQTTGLTTPFTSQVNNSLAKFYDGCDRYESTVTNNKTNFLEFEYFEYSAAVKEVGFAIRQRLGLDFQLTPDELYTIYNLCAYETYIFNNTDWCTLMTDAERQVLEYGQDIKNYYDSMYGNPLNEEVACPLVRDIFLSMDEAVRTLNTTAPGGVTSRNVAGKFLFGHVPTLAKLFAAIGLFKDTPGIMASNMAAMDNRKFRTSHILPYSANLAFVLYRCGLNNEQPRSVRVKLFVNEEAMPLSACGMTSGCDYETLRQAYSRLVDRCDQKQFCEMHSGTIVG